MPLSLESSPLPKWPGLLLDGDLFSLLCLAVFQRDRWGHHCREVILFSSPVLSDTFKATSVLGTLSASRMVF